MKRRTQLVTLVTACCFGAGLPLGAAVAGSASSGWDRFADWGSGTSRHCGAQQATVDTPPSAVNAYGSVRHRTGSGCGIATNVASGYLGVAEVLERADGKICASRAYSYNTSSASQISVPTNQGEGACASWTSLRAWAYGRLYRQSVGAYIDSAAGVSSPFQS